MEKVGKNINEYFSTEEHAYMTDLKDDMTWREFILRGAELIKIYGKGKGVIDG